MADKYSISVIIPAYNEERNITHAIEAVRAATGIFSAYEILVIDDASSDNTGTIADKISLEDPNVRVFHNSKNMGFGYNYRLGVDLATKDYIGMIPGDNEIMEESIIQAFNCVGRADMVLPYHINSGERSLLRRGLSGAFTALLNFLFGYDLKYYNGPVVHRRDLLTKVRMTTDGFAYQAEILLQLLKAGRSYIEVGMKIRSRQHGHSKALYPKNVWCVFKTITKLYWELKLTDRGSAL